MLGQTASKVYRIGFLSSRPLPAESNVGAALLRGFARHGYVPDRKIAIEMRAEEVRWPRMFGQILRLDKWIVCRG